MGINILINILILCITSFSLFTTMYISILIGNLTHTINELNTTLREIKYITKEVPIIITKTSDQIIHLENIAYIVGFCAVLVILGSIIIVTVSGGSNMNSLLKSANSTLSNIEGGLIAQQKNAQDNTNLILAEISKNRVSEICKEDFSLGIPISELAIPLSDNTGVVIDAILNAPLFT